MPPSFLNPGESGTGVRGGCSCTGIPASFLTVDLASGGSIAPCYQIAFFCNDPSPALTVKAVDDTGVLRFDPTPQAFDLDGTTDVDTTCTVTINDFNAEGIVVEWRRSTGGSLIWKATNREAWNPAMRTPLRTLDYDPDSGLTFSPECCLLPMMFCENPFPPTPACACCGDTTHGYGFIVTVDDFGANPDIDPLPADAEEDCRAAAGTYFIPGCGNFSGTRTVTINGSDVDMPYGFSVSELGGVTSLGFNTFSGLTQWAATFRISLCQLFANGEAVTLEPVIPGVGTCEDTFVTVMPVAVDENGTAVDCNGNPLDLTRCPPRNARCRGTSVWKVARGCFDGENDTYVYYWTKVTDGCAGLCSVDTGRCYAKPPFVIDPAPMTNAEAAAYTFGNLVTSLGVEQDGTCECGTEYTPPACVCSGSSVWELARKPCYELTGVAYYLYYWQFISSDCTGSCTCVARIPSSPVLPTDPKSDAEVPSLLAALGTQYDSGCTCDAAYVEPDCPTCASCDDNTGNRTFTLAGFTGGETMYNGTYTLIKGAFDCEFVDCCWYGSDDDFEVNAILTWSGGVWTLSIDGGVGIYEVVDDDCATSITLSKTTGGASWPGSISLTV